MREPPQSEWRDAAQVVLMVVSLAGAVASGKEGAGELVVMGMLWHEDGCGCCGRVG